MGALLGAIITGGIAIGVFKGQKSEKESIEKQQFVKVYNEYKRNLKSLDQHLSDVNLNSKVTNGEYLDEQELQVLIVLTNSLRKEMQTIDIRGIPYDISIYFTNLKEALTTIELLTSALCKAGALTNYKDEYFDAIKQYSQSIKEIESYIERNKL